MFILFPIVSLTLITFLGLWIYDIKEIKQEFGFEGLKKHPVYKYTILILVSIFGSLWLVNSDIISGLLPHSNYFLYGFSGLISVLISALWFQHIDKLDMYEPENPLVLLSVFIVGSGCVYLVYPLTDLFQLGVLKGFTGDLVNDLLYSIAGIGIIEEFVKILPIILLARFTKILNEPFDYLLFGMVSAIGFSFVENTMYLQRSQLNAIDGRALFASPLHIVLTSYICYTWAIEKFKSPTFNIQKILVAFLASAIFHGIYDFWLISDSVQGFYFISHFLLLIGLKIWVKMANNLVNLSNYFDREIKFDPNEHKYSLTFWLVAILTFTYLVKNILYNSEEANSLLIMSVFSYTFLVAFIGINFSNIIIIQGYISPLIDRGDYSLGHFFPLGVIKKTCTGDRVKLFLPQGSRKFKSGENLIKQLPMKGKLTRRVVVNNDPDYYIFKPDKDLILNDVWSDIFLIYNMDSDRILSSKTSVLCSFFGLNSKADLASSVFTTSEIIKIHDLRCKGVVALTKKEIGN